MRDVFCEGPKPPPGEQFCVLCAIVFKQQSLALPDIEEHVQELMRGDASLGQATVDLVKMGRGRVPMPRLAVALGIAGVLNNALVPSCWGHIQAIKFTQLMPGQQMPDASQVPLIQGRR